MRQASVARVTRETDIVLTLALDGQGQHEIETGVPFLDHMLAQLAAHALLNLTLHAKGDVHIDDHHTVEDVGIVLGQGIRRALGDLKGIARYGSVDLPMDETLTRCALDLSGRPFLVWNVPFPCEKIGRFDTELCEEFFRALAMHAQITLHMTLLHGHNAHHIAESCFKAFARAFFQAIAFDPRRAGHVPSTKGVLGG